MLKYSERGARCHVANASLLVRAKNLKIEIVD